jgi:hypothetical protein
MSDAATNRRASLLARGVAHRPSASPGDDDSEHREEHKPSKARSERESRKVNRFAYTRVLTRWQRRLKRTQLALALALWNRAPADGKPFHVSMATLGRDCGGVAGNHVAEEVQRLVELGLVEVVRKGCYQTGEATVFRIPEMPPEP